MELLFNTIRVRGCSPKKIRQKQDEKKGEDRLQFPCGFCMPVTRNREIHENTCQEACFIERSIKIL